MNDKKKMIVMVALVVLVLGVGAFQFTQMSSGPAKPQATAKREAKAEPETATEETVPDAMSQLFSMGAPRDPFLPGTLEQLPGTEPAKPADPPKPPVRTSGGRPKWSDFGGQQAPWTTGLPKPGGDPSQGPGVTPMRDPDAIGYTVSGVITGSKPAAVFVDDKGNQRLVTLGGSLDGDTHLVGVERGRVTIRHNGKNKTFNVGGTPNVK